MICTGTLFWIYIFIYFSDIHSTMSSQKWLTSHSEYENTSAGVGDSVARQAWDVRSTPTQCWLNVSNVDPQPNQPTTKHPCLTGKAAQFDIIIHTEVGPSEDHQLSVDDLLNLFTYFNDYMSLSIITIIINTIVINAWYLSQNNTSNL